MPIFDGDFPENKVLSREYKRGYQDGLEQSRVALAEFFRTLLIDRFGSIPPNLESKLLSITPAEIEAIAPRLSRGDHHRRTLALINLIAPAATAPPNPKSPPQPTPRDDLPRPS